MTDSVEFETNLVPFYREIIRVHNHSWEQEGEGTQLAQEMGQNFIYRRRMIMARSKGVTISVKVPINWASMTERSRQRLIQTVGRDSRIIRAYLGIIEQHENKLLTGKNKDRIDDTKLSKLTMTSQKVKLGNEQRTSVPHDFKVRFPRISQNEMADCRKTSVALYESYLKLKRNRRRVSRPSSINSSRRIPRWTFTRMFRIVKVCRYGV